MGRSPHSHRQGAGCRMKPEDWNDPRLKRIGETFLRDTLDLAGQLEHCGADAARYLLSATQRDEQWAKRGFNIEIPIAFADALMACLIALPRRGQGRGRRRKPIFVAKEM